MKNNYKIRLASDYEFIDLENCGVIENKTNDDGYAIFFEDEAYYIMKMFFDDCSLLEIVDAMTSEYEVEMQQALKDVIELVEQLVQKKIVELIE